jgi:signal peptidase I
MRGKSGRGRVIGRAIFIALALAFAIAPSILTTVYGYGFSPILTGSMAPVAQPGDVFVTRLVVADSLALGDVIAVTNSTTGIYYSHRIIELRDFNGALRITTKGDANEVADRDPFIVSRTGKVSKVVASLPYLGRPMVYMNTAQGRQAAGSFLVIANVLVIFAFLFRKKIVANLTPERVYKELYVEERRTSAQYRELLESLQDSLAIEREEKEKAGNSK